MKLSTEERLFNEIMNERSKLLFDKPYQLLSLQELEKLDKYNHDIAYPIWKPVIFREKPTMYIISNIGIVKNINSGNILQPALTNKGYQIVRLTINKDQFNQSIHRLVAMAFIPNPENKPQVNHINGKKKLNWVDNLEWCTCQENIEHAVKNGLTYRGLGELANGSIYKDDDIHRVCKLLETGKFLNAEISRMTGVDVSVISKVKCRDCWTHISSQYNIPIPVKNATGESAAASKYTTEQIHNVCKLLQDPSNKMTAISKSTGVGYDMIYRIKTGKNWTDISLKYNIVNNRMPAVVDKLE